MIRASPTFIPLHPPFPPRHQTSHHHPTPRCSAHPHRIRIFDTTLRDGLLRTPDLLTRREALLIARQLADLRVDIIEAGFPELSVSNFETTCQIASTVGRCHDAPVICALAKPDRLAVETAFRAVREARFPRLHVYMPIPISRDISVDVQDSILQHTHDIVAFATNFCADVQFSPMNATTLHSTNPRFLAEVYEHAVKAGAKTVSVTDTTGTSSISNLTHLVQTLTQSLEGADVMIAVHAHGGGKNAVQKSIAGVLAGAAQVECTVRGVGEGMAPLENVVEKLALGVGRLTWGTGVCDDEIGEMCRMVETFFEVGV